MRHQLRLYASWRHLLAIFIVLTAPFLFLVFFSKFAHITLNVLFTDIAVSVFRLFIAYILAAVLAWVAAVVFSRGEIAKIALPAFDVLQSFPTFAALPLGVTFFGAGNFTVIFFLVIAVIWPIFFSVVSSFKLIRAEWAEAVKIYNLGGWQYFRKFLLPLSVPGLVVGSVIGLGNGWEALVATEIIVGVKTGLGNFFQSFAANPEITALGITGLLLIIFSINKLLWTPLLDKSHRMFKE